MSDINYEGCKVFLISSFFCFFDGQILTMRDVKFYEFIENYVQKASQILTMRDVKVEQKNYFATTETVRY